MTQPAPQNENGRIITDDPATAWRKKGGRSLNASKHALLLTLFKILVKGNHHYITPSRTKVLEILKKIHGIEIKSRWLGECIKSLVDKQFILRKLRRKNIEAGEIRSAPSLLVLTASGMKYLTRHGIAGASDVWKRTLKWIKGNDHRFPYPHGSTNLTPTEANEAGRARQQRPSNIVEPYERTKHHDALVRLREIISKIG